MRRIYRMVQQGQPASRLTPNLLTLAMLLGGAVSAAQAAETELPAISVTGEDSTGYWADSAEIGGLESAPLLDTPAAIAVFNDALLKTISKHGS